MKLDAGVELALVRAAQAGDERARSRLVEALQPLVRSLALKVARDGESLKDLVQEGTVGLLRALEKFDVGRGTRLSTYATPWIEGEIRGAVRRDHVIALPAAKAVLASRAARAAERLEQELGREPSLGEVAAAVGAAQGDLEEIIHAVRPAIFVAPAELEALVGEAADASLDADEHHYTEGEVKRLIHAFSSQFARLEGMRDPERVGKPSVRSFGGSGIESMLDLEDALSRLPDEQYRAVEVHGFYGLTLPEAAEWLGVHPNTVRNRFDAALRAVVDHLNGVELLPERRRAPDWRPELQPVESLRLAVRRFDGAFAVLLSGAAGEAAEWLNSLEVGWVQLDDEGWVPVFSRDIRETARWMRLEVRSLSAVIDSAEREPLPE